MVDFTAWTRSFDADVWKSQASWKKHLYCQLACNLVWHQAFFSWKKCLFLVLHNFHYHHIYPIYIPAKQKSMVYPLAYSAHTPWSAALDFSSFVACLITKKGYGIYKGKWRDDRSLHASRGSDLCKLRPRWSPPSLPTIVTVPRLDSSPC